MTHRYTLIAIALIAFTIFSCTKFDKIKVVDNDAEYAIPLIDTELTINDILDQFDENTFITIDEDSLITLNYKGDFLEVNSQTVFDIFDQLSGGFEMLDTLDCAPLEAPNSIRIDLVSFKAGLIFFSYRSLHEEDMDIDFRVVNMTKDGEIFEKSLDADYDGNGPVENNGIFSLTDWELVGEDNQLCVVYEARHPDGTRDTLTDVIVGILNVEFDYVEGYLGTDLYELDLDTIEIDVFDNWVDGTVYFEDPTVRMTVNNAFGFPVNSQTNIFNVFTVEGEILPLESPFVDNGIYIDYPTLSEVGEVKTTVFDFTKDNSNIDEILGSKPTAVEYEFDGIPNPDADTTIVGFMDCNSYFNVQVEVALPLHAQVDNFTLFDTILIDPIDFDPSFLWYDNLDYVEFKLKTVNSTALDIPMQIYFLDDDGVQIDSLIGDVNNFIVAAPVDMNGEVSMPQEAEQLIRFEGAQIDNIKAATQMFLKIKFSSYNNGDVPVKILSGEGIRVKVGAKVGFGDE